MPPIDPAALRTRTTALAARFPDAKGVAAGVKSLLDDYADRTYRASPKVAGIAPSNSYKTPAPVLRAIISALREPVRANPLAALPVLDALWAAGSREERRIAAELLGQAAPQAPAEALALVETWVPRLDSGESADALAELGLGALIQANPSAHLEQARRWMSHSHRWARRFGLAMLLPLVKDRHWDNVPGALAVLRPAMTESDGEVRRAAATMLEHLAAKSPGEISRFLREQAYRPNIHTHWIVRSAMAALSPSDQAEITRALRM